MNKSHGTTFDRQVDHLIEIGYPALARCSERKFRAAFAPLRAQAESLVIRPVDSAEGRLPFVVVVNPDWIPVELTMPLVEQNGKRGRVAMTPHVPSDFHPIDSVAIPPGRVYLLIGIDRGDATLNVRPEDAMKTIRRARRTPLTISEGVAIVIHAPDFLKKNHCFSLLASRRADQRVPAIWIDGAKAPKLGWCWDRNPHTWLGSASAKKRIGGGV